MGTGPEALIKKRKMQAEYLSIQADKKKTLPQYYQSQADLVVEFFLYMQHHDQESQLVDAILNYYQVSYVRVKINNKAIRNLNNVFE